MIDHTVVAPKSGFQRNGAQMAGRLYDQNHKAMNYSAPNVIGVLGQPDIIQLDLLLKAAGIDSLDSISTRDMLHPNTRVLTTAQPRTSPSQTTPSATTAS